jgi:hypothetical protein
MRICDKCKVNQLHTTLKEVKYGNEIDLCSQCFEEFQSFMKSVPFVKETEAKEELPSTTKFKRRR